MVDIDKAREHVSKWTREGRQLMREALNELEVYQIRNTPMKVVKETNYEIGSIQNIHRCPNCSHIVDNHYCSDCGQKLNWSENDE